MERGKLRNIPSLDSLLRRQRVAALQGEHGRVTVRDTVRRLLDELRSRLQNGDSVSTEPEEIEQELDRRLEEAARPGLRRVINATGKLRHSVAFLVATRSDVVVECIPSCQGPDNPAKYEPSNYADYIAAIRKMNYDIGEADAAE